MNTKIQRWIVAFTSSMILIASCKPKDNDYIVPSTYNFPIVKVSDQTECMEMLEEMLAYMDTALVNSPIDAAKLKDMYTNVNYPFVNEYLNDLGSRCYPGDSTLLVNLFDSIALASNSIVTGSNGTAGIVTSITDPSKKYLFSAKGMQYSEQIEKMIMGSVFYYQATAVKLGDAEMGDAVNNITIVPGEGTAMEHHWDEAFGYFGVPFDFPITTTGSFFFGEYATERNFPLHCSQPLMNAFILGRTAISNKDLPTKNEQIPVVRSWWEKIVAGSAIHYLNAAKTNLGDDALRNHQLSEAWGFIYMLKYNPAKVITQLQIDGLLQTLGTNFYTITGVAIDNARNQLSTIYSMDAIKTQL